jgi:hypothetical protein
MLSYKTRMIHTVCFLPISNIKLFEFVAVVYWFVWYIVGLCACLKCGISWVCVLASSVVYRGFVCLSQVWYIVGLCASLKCGISWVCVPASSVVYRGFELQSGQTKDYEIGICCFSTKNATCRIKYWLAWNQDNVS